ncbi:MAG TPA: NYN domain-containing protein [Aeromicrobium sp.]|nr:NYN domain-containing protein [Aeromicrobium sp.]
MSETNDRLAVLIDADNTQPKRARAILDELAKYGVTTIKRAYGDWTTTQLSGWKNACNEHAIQPVQQFAYTTGKNSTDSALIIDAMDLLHTGNVDGFALVSSDSDFTRLATRLRESGKKVYGLGMRKTPASLAAAVDLFIYLEVLPDAEPGLESDLATDPTLAPAELPNLEGLLTRAINAISDDAGLVRLDRLGQYLQAADSSFDSRRYGHAKLSTLVQAQAYLTMTGTGNGRQVALKTARKPARKAPAKKAN